MMYDVSFINNKGRKKKGGRGKIGAKRKFFLLYIHREPARILDGLYMRKKLTYNPLAEIV